MKKSRKTVSILLLLSFIMLTVSGIIILPMPSDGTNSHTWLHLHVLFAIIFIVAGIYHIVHNWKTLKMYFKK
ncbi:MAG: DUF4405 domain-containing protein [Bacteroidales bacterium]|nr:DUF4405 domain-containing protein [Bacteroidales bacterium]